MATKETTTYAASRIRDRRQREQAVLAARPPTGRIDKWRCFFRESPAGEGRTHSWLHAMLKMRCALCAVRIGCVPVRGPSEEDASGFAFVCGLTWGRRVRADRRPRRFRFGLDRRNRPRPDAQPPAPAQPERAEARGRGTRDGRGQIRICFFISIYDGRETPFFPPAETQSPAGGAPPLRPCAGPRY